MTTPHTEEEIRRIVREEIALDELRKIEMESRQIADGIQTPGLLRPRPGVQPPGVIWFGYDPAKGEDTGE